MSGGGGPFGPAALPHDVAMVLRAGDVVRVDTGVATTDATINQVAEEIAAGAHVTLAAALATAEAGFDPNCSSPLSSSRRHTLNWN